MTTFPKPTALTPDGLVNFTISATVHEADAGATTVVLNFSVARTASSLGPYPPLDTISGDLSAYLTAAQITNFQNVANSLYAKAKLELLG